MQRGNSVGVQQAPPNISPKVSPVEDVPQPPEENGPPATVVVLPVSAGEEPAAAIEEVASGELGTPVLAGEEPATANEEAGSSELGTPAVELLAGEEGAGGKEVACLQQGSKDVLAEGENKSINYINSWVDGVALFEKRFATAM